jgi:cation transport ATPase
VTLRRAETVAVAVVGVVAVATLGYRLGAGTAMGVAMGSALAVLLVAVPCAVHLATATPLRVAAGRAARHGILLADVAAAAHRLDTVVLAGTGVLMTGAPVVQDVRVAQGVSPDDVLRLAGAVAQESGRQVDRAIAAASQRLPGVAEFDLDDLGARGVVAEVVEDACGEEKVVAHAVLVGRVELLTAYDIDLPAELAPAPSDAVATGRTAVAVAWDGVARAVLAVGRVVPPSHAAAVRVLRGLGLRTVLLTAEAAPAGLVVAAQAGIDADGVIAQVAPPDAATVVRRLRDAGARVAVVSEGAHGAALAAADLAVRTDPSAEAAPAGVTVVQADLPAAVDAIRLARRARAVACANLVWALACVAAVVPVAAMGLLGPALAAAATAAGATVVVANSLRLGRLGRTGG